MQVRGGDEHCVSPGMVHHSGKIWDVGDGINGHTDTPCTPINVMHFFDKKTQKKTKLNIEIDILLATGKKTSWPVFNSSFCLDLGTPRSFRRASWYRGYIFPTKGLQDK